ncbi:MAG: AAA family ATPase [Ruminococcaceae bacterium]|nr:AAA family ATPase [Oscillospiraceae bacterium]
MDRKDEIILQQMELIRSMTQRNLRSMSNDFWGTPLAPKDQTPADDRKLPENRDTSKPEENKPVSGQQETAKEQPQEEAEALPKENIADLQAELDSYIGLETVKEEVRSLINMVSVYKLRKEHNLPTTDMSLHMVFTGNPGTGKTMMARMMARIYRSLDILSKGQLVEVDRSGLVAGYVGQTALKTQKVIQKAMGGVLFIDEAYALNGKSENDFGQEAIDTILKAMEDNRDDLVVIVAGYTDLMDRFIHSNPGLESRFNRFLHFADYNADEMLKIFHMQCKKGCYQLAEGVEPLVRDYITEENGDPETFGNARGVRNIFEHILVAQNNRLAAMQTVTREDLMTITPDDILHARGKIDE